MLNLITLNLVKRVNKYKGRDLVELDSRKMHSKIEKSGKSSIEYELLPANLYKAEIYL